MKVVRRVRLDGVLNKKAFALIEVIITLVIITVLILIGVPKYNDYTKTAKLTEIKSNVKTVEDVALVSATKTNLTGKRIDFLSDKLANDRLIFKDSEDMSGSSFTDTDFLQINEDFILNNTTIKKDTDRYYFSKSKKIVGYLPKDIDDMYLASSDDFDFIEAWYGYEIKDGRVGYYKYVGDKKIVKIPYTIKGNELQSYSRMFEGTGVEKVISDNPNIKDTSLMFNDGTASKIDVSELNTSKVTDMSSMFKDTFNTKEIILKDLNTNEVTNMNYMFLRSGVESLNLSSFNTSKVKTMWGMFQDSKAKTITFSNDFKTTSVTNMEDMFKGCIVESLDLSSFDTSSVNNMKGMFEGTVFKELSVLNFKTDEVTTMESMFASSNIKVLDLSSFNLSGVFNVRSMFKDAKAESGYARTDADATKLNKSLNKPLNLVFTTK